MTAEPVTLPGWMECSEKDERGESLTALERFILDNEPAGIGEETAFLAGLAAVLKEERANRSAAVIPSNERSLIADVLQFLKDTHQADVVAAAEWDKMTRGKLPFTEEHQAMKTFRRREALIARIERGAHETPAPRSLAQAKDAAEKAFDEWNDVTGVFSRGVSYDAEIRSAIADAVEFGWKAAPRSKFDMAFEIMRQLEAEKIDTMQSSHFGFVLRVERERASEKTSREAALDEVVRISEEAGLYDDALFCKCGHSFGQHSKGAVRDLYCRHCECEQWQPGNGTGKP